MKISNAAARAKLDALTALLNGGGHLRIYDGAEAGEVDEAIGAQVLLAELNLSATAFAGAVDANPGATATANAITDEASAPATGTATWFRAVDSGGNAVIDGPVGAELVLTNASIAAGQPVSVSSWVITQAES